LAGKKMALVYSMVGVGIMELSKEGFTKAYEAGYRKVVKVGTVLTPDEVNEKLRSAIDFNNMALGILKGKTNGK
jgi:hypothetical protein